MNSDQPNSPWIQTYHLCFVIVLTAVFFLVMLMSVKEQGLEHFNENFFQRNLLIASFNRLRLKIGDRVFNNVLVGKDGWLEFTGDRNLDDYQNALNFSPEGLATVAATIQDCHAYAREHNMTFLLVVAPNKASTYPDKLPDQIQPVSSLSRIDQLNQYLKEHDIPQVLDLRPALREARQDRAVYYKMGTHWNEYGAYVAYKTIINALAQDHPDLEPYALQFFRFRNNPAHLIGRGDMEVAGMLQARHLSLEPSPFFTRNLNEVYSELDFPIPRTIESYHKISWIPNSNLPSLMMYHDSFGETGLNSFLALNFREAFFIHRNAASTFLNWGAIEQFDPDVVIYEIVERNLIWIQNEIAGCSKE